MIYERDPASIAVFVLFVAVTLGLSFVLGSRAKSAQGYFAAHGQIPWFVNGVAFAGDYLSAASFLGICGMIAFYGYDGFLYSIGYLAGWIVALFVVAEPMKRLGKFTFADALDARFRSRGIKLAAGISTLAVSLFYLIPQMVGAGALVRPLFGLPHWAGVVLVGAIVLVIVVTAGMVSTTWVQFLKGSLLVVFSLLTTVMILQRGLGVGERWMHLDTAGLTVETFRPRNDPDWSVVPAEGNWAGRPYVRMRNAKTGALDVWRQTAHAKFGMVECQTVTTTAEGKKRINGLPQGPTDSPDPHDRLAGTRLELFPVGELIRVPSQDDGTPPRNTGPLGPLEFLGTLQKSEVALWRNETIVEADGAKTVVYYPVPTSGATVLQPGNLPALSGLRTTGSDAATTADGKPRRPVLLGLTVEELLPKVNFVSLMLALFGGTASLPHILIRYYTVKDESSARKSTIVGIASIGFFYVLTLYLGLGAMTSGSLDPTDSNMAAPLLARGIAPWLFAAISAIAFTTVLGTVSGLILAAAGAVTHDLALHVLKIELTDHEQVRLAKSAAAVVGGIAIGLGIAFEKMNVSFLVGWAFSVAASANLPALVMALFWKRTTRQGVIAAVVVGMTTSLAWILVSADTMTGVYGLKAGDALVPFSQPGLVTIPLGFVTLIVVSLLTKPQEEHA